MSRTGIGPTLASLSISYFVSTVALAIYFSPFLRLPVISKDLRITIGAAFIAMGIVLYITGVIFMLKAYNADKLCTSGAFALCRHPIYSAWICFIVPGLSFWANSLLSFTTPLVMYIIFKILIKKEDRYLMTKFDTDYILYKKNTPEILPLGWLKKTKL